MKLGYTVTFQDIRSTDYFGHLHPRKSGGYIFKMEAWSGKDDGIIAKAACPVLETATLQDVNRTFTAFIDDVDNGTSILNIKRHDKA